MPVRLAFIGGRGRERGKKKAQVQIAFKKAAPPLLRVRRQEVERERESLGGAWVLAKGVPAGAHKGRGLRKGTRRNPDLR